MHLGSGPFLRAVENIAARSAVIGTAIFETPKSTVPRVPSDFYILLIMSQLTGTERAFNTLDFAEVTKPYPRTLEELNEYNVRCATDEANRSRSR
jgi:hypothetical protein